MVKIQLMMEEVSPKLIAEEFFSLGADVITSGNHIWDKEGDNRFYRSRKETS